jgi:biotin transporter BioY
VTVVLLYGYLGGWMVTSIVAALVARRLQDDRDRIPNSALMSIIAGAAWPVLVLALAEAGVMALTAEALHEDDRRLAYET